jgi:hypothetical protein
MNSPRKMQLTSMAVVATGALALLGLGHSRVAAAACQAGSHCIPELYQMCEMNSQASRDRACSNYVPAGCTLYIAMCLGAGCVGGPNGQGLLCAWK